MSERAGVFCARPQLGVDVVLPTLLKPSRLSVGQRRWLGSQHPKEASLHSLVSIQALGIMSPANS